MFPFDAARLKRVARRYALDLVVLFGSHAKGRPRAGSDVDVAVRVRPGRRWTEEDKPQIAARVAAAFPKTVEVDVSFLNDAGSMLLFEVARSGQPLFEGEPLTFWQFQSYAARRYDDDYKYRLRRDNYLKRKLSTWDRSRKPSSATS